MARAFAGGVPGLATLEDARCLPHSRFVSASPSRAATSRYAARPDPPACRPAHASCFGRSNWWGIASTTSAGLDASQPRGANVFSTSACAAGRVRPVQVSPEEAQAAREGVHQSTS